MKIIQKLNEINENEQLQIDIPQESLFENLPFECQLRFMCYVKSAELLSSMGSDSEAVEYYLHVQYMIYLLNRPLNYLRGIYLCGKVFIIPCRCVTCIYDYRFRYVGFSFKNRVCSTLRTSVFRSCHLLLRIWIMSFSTCNSAGNFKIWTLYNHALQFFSPQTFPLHILISTLL